MPTKSGIIGTVKIKMKDGTYVDLPDPISLEEITTFAEQYEFVKVVRCKDCEYWRDSNLFDGETFCELTTTRCEGEHFCSWGELKDG